MITNSQKASLIILLSTISNKTILTKYTFPKFANTSCYQVKNANDGVDFYITDFSGQDLGDELKQVFNSVWHEYMGEYILNESQLDSDKFIINKVGRLLAKYKNTNSVDKFLRDISVYDQKNNLIDDEFAVIMLAECFGKACLDDIESLKQPYFTERLFDLMKDVVLEEVEKAISENKWAYSPNDNEIGESSKVKAKLLTYVILNGVVDCAIGTNKMLGNTLCLSMINDSGEVQTTSFHTKQGKELVNNEFAAKLYARYFKALGIKGMEELSLAKQEEKFVAEFSKRYDPTNAAEYIITFVDKICAATNLGEDQVVTMAAALNTASYLDSKDEFGQDTNMGFYGKDKADIDEILEENFALAKSNPKEAAKRIKAAYSKASNIYKHSKNISNIIKDIMDSFFNFGDSDPEKE